MLQTAIYIAFALTTAALIMNMWRMVKGPDLVDRIVALDTMYINTIALLILAGIYMASALFFEAALLIAMMGFVGTVALCKYLLRGNIIE
ncbi:K+/H+ antiporter subunit F [Persicimonas caeni]|jgi:multicomponent K+:H+ antiporter subunit F|uniref:K+/H+ antiporter subunit F n=1 Tax=Persicimonas caeni TaxID=2292766 RepID=A0A4Y6PYF3_PERCE|nr:K+/H+ antiporter subunit F [Persicimonas caeni]QDG53037.1 K+/H+ antiporter subunit F [Persicimonas caeni]QED34259.1 K+/H+ antiporter subunit F [Persicimonas caeni]